jgi:hypothetical protein
MLTVILKIKGFSERRIFILFSQFIMVGYEAQGIGGGAMEGVGCGYTNIITF